MAKKYNYTEKTGRPTNYSEKVLQIAKAYLLSCEDEEVERESDRGTQYKLKVKLPTIEKLAKEIGVSRDTLYEWAKHHKEFSDILEDLRLEQADKLINNGLSGDYNSTIAKLILSSNHDMREKNDTTSGGKPINIVFDDSFNK